MKPKKSLGQNFLQDEKALKQIVAAADLTVDNNVLEIGPGTGILTNELTSELSNGKVIAIEKDRTLARDFENKKPNLIIVEGDVLEVNLPELFENNDFLDYKVVANIPYYITGKIVRLLLETKYVPKVIVLLVQKEVAQRVCADPGEMSILSVTAQFFGKCEIVDFVPKESFFPVPKVDSAIIRISPFEDNDVLREKAKQIFPIMKMGFSSRRKTLLNNLVSGLQASKRDVKGFLQACSLDENTRAQNLSVEQWKVLSDQVQGYLREEQK